MDFEAPKPFNSTEENNAPEEAMPPQEAATPASNSFYEFLEDQGYKIDRNDVGSVLRAIEDMKQTEAFNAAPIGIEGFEESLRPAETVEEPKREVIDPARLEVIAAWLRNQGEEFSAVSADRPESIIEAFNLQKAIEAKDRAFADPDAEVDNFYDAPVGMEKDIEKLKELV